MRTAVIGGGITGLTAAYDLVKRGHDVVLFERSARTGGIVETRRHGARVLELGPDCFLTGQKPWAHELAIELGLEPELIRTTETHRRSFVLTRGSLEPVPQGFHLIAPTDRESFLGSPILSSEGKKRALAEDTLPPAPREDESLRSFVVRRFGEELFARLAEPLVAGIYTADPGMLSLRATFPQFLEMERTHGSVTRALAMKHSVDASGARYGLFATFREGCERLTEALRAKLPEGTVRTGEPVRSVRREGRAWIIQGDRGSEGFDAVLIALPAPAAASVLEGHDAELARLLREIPYASAATANFVFRRSQVRHPLDAMGFVCPEVEERFILACSFSSTKFSGRTRGDDEVLLRAFVGGARHAERVALGSDGIARRALDDLRELLGIDGEPIETAVHIMERAMPQYVLGHVDLVAAIEKQASLHQGLALAGNALRGVGLPDCVKSARSAVGTLVQRVV